MWVKLKRGWVNLGNAIEVIYKSSSEVDVGWLNGELNHYKTYKAEDANTIIKVLSNRSVEK